MKSHHLTSSPLLTVKGWLAAICLCHSFGYSQSISITAPESSIDEIGVYAVSVSYDAPPEAMVEVMILDQNGKSIGRKVKAAHHGSHSDTLIVEAPNVLPGKPHSLFVALKHRGDPRGEPLAADQQPVDVIKRLLVEEVQFQNLPSHLTLSGTYTFEVLYAAGDERDIAVSVFGKDWNGYLGGGTAQVGPGEGSVAIDVRAAGLLPEGESILVVEMRPRDGGWDDGFARVNTSLPVQAEK
jgi:hypothetical protein